MRKLDQLDKNKDGYFDKEDLVGVVEKLMQEERQSHVYKRAVCFAAGLMVFVLLANVGLAYGEDPSVLSRHARRGIPAANMHRH